MTLQSEQHDSYPRTSEIWQPDAAKSFGDLCQSEGLNPVRLQRLIDRYVATRQRPSRQELIDTLKRRPRIQDRAAALGSITDKLRVFLETFVAKS